MTDSAASIESIALGVSVGLLLVLLTWESFSPYFDFFRDRSRPRLVHVGKNLALGLLNALMIGLAFTALWLWASRLAESRQFGVTHWLDLPVWVEAVISLLVFDFWTYWWHRFNHRIPFLWRFHRMHHSDPEMDVTTANRFHVGEIAMSSLLRVPLILMLGAPLWHLALYEALMFPIVQFHHANVGVPAWLDRALRIVIVTPAMHKVHHSRWQPETDSNYTSMLSLWDRLFGSFRLREDLRAIRFGLDGFDADDRQSLPGLLATPLDRGDGTAAGTRQPNDAQ